MPGMRQRPALNVKKGRENASPILIDVNRTLLRNLIRFSREELIRSEIDLPPLRGDSVQPLKPDIA